VSGCLKLLTKYIICVYFQKSGFPNNMMWKVQMMKLLVIQFSTSSLSSKCFSQWLEPISSLWLRPSFTPIQNSK
jgi:hypothetical protein